MPSPWRPLNQRQAGVCALLLVLAGALFLWVSQSLQAQSVQRGQLVYAARCAACHSLDENRTGPRHRGVLNRPVGSVPDFDYSPALRNSQLLWTRANLRAWLTDPEALIPGQGMDFHLDRDQDRDDVVAYLASLAPPGK
jgi:cytochrome c